MDLRQYLRLSEVDQKQVAVLLNVLTITVLAIAALFVIVSYYGSPFPPVFVAVILALAIAVGIVRLLMYWHKLIWASLFFVVTLWLIITVTIALFGGMTSPVLTLYIGVIVIATLIFNSYIGIIIALLSIISSFIMVSMGINTPHPHAAIVLSLPLFGWLIQLTQIIVVMSVLHITSQRTRQALNQAKQNETALADSNQKLQQEVLNHQKVQESLRLSEEKYRDLLDSLPVGVFQTTYERDNGRFLAANQALVKMLGSSSLDDLMNHTINDFYRDPEDRLKIINAFQETGEINNRQVELVTLQGRSFWGAISAIMRYKDDQPYFEGIITDITERIEAQTEREHLLAAEQEQRLLAESFSTISLALTSQTNFSDVLDEILHQAQQLVPYTTANIMIREQNTLRIARWSGHETLGTTAYISTLVQSLSDLPVDAEVVETRQPVIIPDTWQDNDWVFRKETRWIRSYICFPLAHRDVIVGLLRLNGRQPNQFSQNSIERLQALGHAAAIALENARLLETAEQRAHELEIIRQANLVLTASLELETVLDAILDSTLKLSQEASDAFVFLYKAPRLTYGAARWADGNQENELVDPRDSGTTYQVAQTGTVAIVPDMAVHPNYKDAPSHWQGALASLPLKIGTRVVGVMNIHYRRPHDWPEAQLRLLQLLGDQAALAIENARLYQQAQQEINARKQIESAIWDTLAQNETVYNFMKSLIIQDNLQDVLQTAADHAANTMSANCIYILLCDIDAQKITHSATGGPGANAIEPITFNELMDGLSGWVLRERQPALSTTNKQDPRESEYTRQKRAANKGGSIIVVPLQYRQRTWGTMTAINLSDEVDFIQPDVELMVTMANSLTIAIDNIYLFDQAQQEISERKRAEESLARHVKELMRANEELERLAYVMSHDLKSPLNGIARISEWLEEDLGDLLSDENREHMTLLRRRVYRLEALINGTMHYLRLRQTEHKEEEVDVHKMLIELIDLVKPPQFTIEIGPNMPTFVTDRISFEQVFSNLISNAIKYHHQPNGRVVITVQDEGGPFYQFSVADDGPGIDPAFHQRIFVIFQTLQTRDDVESSGIGLALVKRVIENQGGSISLESSEGNGTTFHFTWPKSK